MCLQNRHINMCICMPINIYVHMCVRVCLHIYVYITYILLQIKMQTKLVTWQVMGELNKHLKILRRYFYQKSMSRDLIPREQESKSWCNLPVISWIWATPGTEKSLEHFSWFPGMLPDTSFTYCLLLRNILEQAMGLLFHCSDKPPMWLYFK